jgi:hypothetical protein
MPWQGGGGLEEDVTAAARAMETSYGSEPINRIGVVNEEVLFFSFYKISHHIVIPRCHSACSY